MGRKSVSTFTLRNVQEEIEFLVTSSDLQTTTNGVDPGNESDAPVSEGVDAILRGEVDEEALKVVESCGLNGRR